jgi:ABC-2 type transport system ATP-binding protein
MPVLTATGAGVRHRRGWLFRDLDVTAEPGDLVAVVGMPGSGRTTVMLALARRFRLSAGKVDLFGTAALGYVPDVEQPEPVFSVAEHVRERLALLGRPSRDAAAVLADGLYGLDPALKGWQLTPYQKQLLGLALARLGNPAVIALDGVDDGLDAREQAELWRILGELAAAGVALVMTAREIDPDRVTTVVRLADPQAAEPAASDAPVSDLAVSGPASAEPELAEAAGARDGEK